MTKKEQFLNELFKRAINSDNLDYIKEQLDAIYNILKEDILEKNEAQKDYASYVQTIYDELLEQQEQRGISYGEIAYIDSLSQEQLNNLELEIEEELYKIKEITKED